MSLTRAIFMLIVTMAVAVTAGLMMMGCYNPRFYDCGQCHKSVSVPDDLDDDYMARKKP